jgi:hypothetical protein
MPKWTLDTVKIMADYTGEWLAAGYENEMGSASFLPAPPKRFIRLYHFTSAKHALSNLEDSRLKIARFSDTNDPFELMGLMLREESVRHAVKEFKKARNADTGILCFSTNWTNPLLWSHYGEKHAGVCLGFDVKESLSQPVSYEENRLLTGLSLKRRSFVLDQNIKERLLLIKSHHWKYECERRVFVALSKAMNVGSHYFRPFDKNMRLAEVILGPRCGLKLEEVRKVALATDPCAITFRSRLEFGRFRVIRNGWDLPSIAKAVLDRPKDCK